MTKETGVVNIRGREYETVASRVQRFRTDFTFAYSIETELVERDEQSVVMKATIRDLEKDTVVATGYAEENRNASQINRTSALENAETSAIGRALAAFGMAGTEYASADEVANAIGQQTAPVKATAPELATDMQRSQIKAFMRANGVQNDEDIPGILKRDYGVKGKLTKAEAVRVLKEMA